MAFFSATNKNIPLPVSAHECAASATIEAEPVIKAAKDLAIAIRKLAPIAIKTVITELDFLSSFLLSGSRSECLAPLRLLDNEGLPKCSCGLPTEGFRLIIGSTYSF